MIEKRKARAFLDGCGERASRVTRRRLEKMFEDILKFGGYAFNKAHSTGYAIVAFQTAYMKVYHPVEFMAALMTFEMSSTDKVAEYREACRDMGIAVEPPNVNTSDYDFTVEHRQAATTGNGQAKRGASGGKQAARGSKARNGTGSRARNGKQGTAAAARNGSLIRFGLGAIKGVGERAVSAIVEERQANGPYRSIFDFCERVDLTAVNRGCLEALIDAGSFDDTGAMRKALSLALDRAIAGGQSAQKDKRAGQMSLFGGGGGGGDTGGAADGDDQALAESALGNEQWTEAEMLSREKAVLGFYITKHPLARHEQLLDACTTARIGELDRYPDGEPAIVGGIVTHVKTVTPRSGRNAGKPMGIITLEDLTGRFEAMLFAKEYAEYRPILVPDAVLFLQGQVDKRREEPTLRTERVIVQDDAVEMLTKALLLDIRDRATADALPELLRQHRGPTPVYLDVHTANRLIAQIECDPSLRVACTTPLLQSLVRLVGPSSVVPLGLRQRRMPLPPEALHEWPNLAAGASASKPSRQPVPA
jgi:DNA polymerase-3 subunit alpha